jgi:hypothetical protein
MACQSKQEPAVSSPRPARVRTVNIPQDVSSKRATIIDPVGTAVIDRMVVGTQLGPDGTVTQQSRSVTAGAPIYLTLRLRDSPVGLRTSAVWLDSHGQQVTREQKDMNGLKIATFALTQTLPPGTYRVQGYWGGNIVGDVKFEVLPKPKRSK